jgi:two-component system, sensor histidine kinase PdtaS
MAIVDSRKSADSPRSALFGSSKRRTVASYERELTAHRCTEIQLREALAREEALLRQKNELIQQLEVLGRESDHRLLNGLQMIGSLLSLQSRASSNGEAALQLAIAADRVATVGRVHRRLHSIDGVQTVAFKQYLKDLCSDFSTILSSEDPDRVIVVEGIEIKLPTATAIPLSFIANELITNAAKYGKGRITVSLEAKSGKGYALSVTNDGPALPQGFDPTSSRGLGMTIVRSFVERIGGELRFGRDDGGQGARFTVLFPCAALYAVR